MQREYNFWHFLIGLWLVWLGPLGWVALWYLSTKKWRQA